LPRTAGKETEERESLQALANDIEISGPGYPETPPDSRDSLFNLSSFLDAIADGELRYEVKKQKPRSLREALNEAVKIEMWIKSKSEKDGLRPKGVRGVRTEEEMQQIKPLLNQELPQLERSLDRRSGAKITRMFTKQLQ